MDHTVSLYLKVTLTWIWLVQCEGKHASMSEIQTMIFCNFDNGICNWSQNNETDNFDWTRYSGPTPTRNTGPDNDHTTGTGHYIYIETSAPRKTGENAILISPTIDTWNDNYLCFSVWYHARGAELGQFSIYQRQTEYMNKTTTLWKFDSNERTIWTEARATIIPTGPFRIIIEAQVGNGYQGDIAIDDINISSGSCSSEFTTKASTTPSPGAVMIG